MSKNAATLGQRLAKHYNWFIETYPFLSQSIQAATVVTAGDLIAQLCIEKRHLGKDYSLRRTLEFSTLGFAYVAPLQTFWYKFLSKHVGQGTTKDIVLKKVAADQLFCAPVFGWLCLLILGCIQLKTPKETYEMATSLWFPILINNYKVWPLVQFVNFMFMPLKFQVLFAQIVGVFWNSYVSWQTHQDYSKDAKE